MNWEMISAVGQMLGAIGVIISIVYLAAQIQSFIWLLKSGTKTRKASARR